jgi:TetR/AcrR family transcriptional regulator, tetracycline repressor protein
MADTAGTRDGRRRRLQRGDLTRELIVRESLRLLDTEGIAGFSLPKLGRALGADATAVYRHFASKDALVLAVADHLIEASAALVRPKECWVETLTDICRQTRHTYLAHPAAASLSSYRITQGPAEMKVVDAIIGCVLKAGFEGAEAAVVYRAIGDFGLYWAGGEASFLAMDEQLQKNDRDAWTSAYLTADRAAYPAIWQVREHLPAVDDNEIFEMSLSLMLAGLYARAPRPCQCPRHAPAHKP